MRPIPLLTITLALTVLVGVDSVQTCVWRVDHDLLYPDLERVCSILGCSTAARACPSECFYFTPPAGILLSQTRWDEFADALHGLFPGTACVHDAANVRMERRPPQPPLPQQQQRLPHHIIRQQTDGGGSTVLLTAAYSLLLDRAECHSPGLTLDLVSRDWVAAWTSALSDCTYAVVSLDLALATAICTMVMPAHYSDNEFNSATDALRFQLSGLDHVMGVQARPRPRPSNPFTSELVDRGASGAANSDNAHPGVNWPSDATAGGVLSWDTTLDGRGQIIQHVDTGVRLGSCFLRDTYSADTPAVDCGNTGTPLNGQILSFPDRRKVIQYVYDVHGSGLCGDGTDTNGHGTHTATTVAGATECYPSTCASTLVAYAGRAPGAKLAVFDAGPDTHGYLILPDDLTTQLFPWGYAVGARVGTNSWGDDSSPGLYTILDYQFDSFVYSHPDMVLLVAAGNTGSSGALGTVSSPAVAKNVISVGASVSEADSFRAAYCGSNAYSPSSSLCDTYTNPALFSEQDMAYFSSSGLSGSGKRAKPDVVAPGHYTWSAALADVGACTYSTGSTYPWQSGVLTAMAGTSMSTPHVAGLAAQVRQYFMQGFWPCGNLGEGAGGPQWTTVPASLVKAVIIGMTRALQGHKLDSSSGTTVAVANISDTAHGWPNPYQGYGMPFVYGTLRTPTNPSVAPLFLPSLSLDALPDGLGAEYVFHSTGETFTRTVCLNSVSPASGNASSLAAVAALQRHLEPRAVLAWIDPPSSPLTGLAADLVNDLDLTLYTADMGSVVARGNARVVPSLVGDPGRTSPTTMPDNTSNVEVVSLYWATSADIGTRYTLVVTATRLATTPQAFSLVMLNGFGPCDPVSEDGGLYASCGRPNASGSSAWVANHSSPNTTPTAAPTPSPGGATFDVEAVTRTMSLDASAPVSITLPTWSSPCVAAYPASVCSAPDTTSAVTLWMSASLYALPTGTVNATAPVLVTVSNLPYATGHVSGTTSVLGRPVLSSSPPNCRRASWFISVHAPNLTAVLPVGVSSAAATLQLTISMPAWVDGGRSVQLAQRLVALDLGVDRGDGTPTVATQGENWTHVHFLSLSVQGSTPAAVEDAALDQEWVVVDNAAWYIQGKYTLRSEGVALFFVDSRYPSLTTAGDDGGGDLDTAAVVCVPGRFACDCTQDSAWIWATGLWWIVPAVLLALWAMMREYPGYMLLVGGSSSFPDDGNSNVSGRLQWPIGACASLLVFGLECASQKARYAVACGVSVPVTALVALSVYPKLSSGKSVATDAKGMGLWLGALLLVGLGVAIVGGVAYEWVDAEAPSVARLIPVLVALVDMGLRMVSEARIGWLPVLSFAEWATTVLAISSRRSWTFSAPAIACLGSAIIASPSLARTHVLWSVHLLLCITSAVLLIRAACT